MKFFRYSGRLFYYIEKLEAGNVMENKNKKNILRSILLYTCIIVFVVSSVLIVKKLVWILH